MKVSSKLARAAWGLSVEVEKLEFSPPVTYVYNPLRYAWAAHELYLRRFATSPKRVVFVGCNPGPFGMVQTGVPFGEIWAVRDWMGISAPISKPEEQHPRRPVSGFECARSEVSGRRLWGLFAERFKTPERFFVEHFVVNYCPLAFMEESGRNRTPDNLPAAERAPLFAACDRHLERVLEVLQPEWTIAVGGCAAKRARAATERLEIKLGQVLHPSPASPLANRDWAGTATRQLTELGVWKRGGRA